MKRERMIVIKSKTKRNDYDQDIREKSRAFELSKSGKSFKFT